MKVLLSAIACHPDWGSESKFGWDAACAISGIPEVSECHVMTHCSAADAIERKQKEGVASNVRFHFSGSNFQYYPNRLLARFQGWLKYRSWQKQCLETAKRLHQQYRFSLTHHITYATWRMPSQLWRLPVPFILGPIGGGSKIPGPFNSILSPSGRLFEFVRDTGTLFAKRSSALAQCCHQAAAVIAADYATKDFFRRLGVRDVYTLSPAFFTEQHADQFRRKPRLDSTANPVLRIFAGGNLEARKGTQMSLRALAKIKNKGIPFYYTYGGWGPDLRAMRALADELGIKEQVNFHEGYSGDDYLQQLRQSDVYLLPSVREMAGITMMEAMMTGCYPIVLAGTGAGDIVEQAGGAAIRAETPDEAIHKIAQQLEQFHCNTTEMRRQAALAGENVRTMYSAQSYQIAMSRIYADAIERYARRA